MRFIDSAKFPLICGLILCGCSFIFLPRGWIAGAVATFGTFLAIEGVVWNRLFGPRDGGPMAEEQLVHSFGWAKRRYGAALMLTVSACMVLYFYGSDGWQGTFVLIAVPILYISLLAFDFVRAIHAVDERIP
jgi:hypothetical protein